MDRQERLRLDNANLRETVRQLEEALEEVSEEVLKLHIENKELKEKLLWDDSGLKVEFMLNDIQSQVSKRLRGE